MGEVVQIPVPHMGPARRERIAERMTEGAWRTAIWEPTMREVIREVVAERERQDALWGPQHHKDPHEFLSILTEEVGEVAKAINEWGDQDADASVASYVTELVQVAAVAVAAIEVIRHQTEGKQ